MAGKIPAWRKECMSRINKGEIAGNVRMVTQGKRTRMKAILGAIEDQFDGLALICVDKKKDTIIFGSKYVNEQERLYDESQQIGDLDGIEGET